MSGALTRTLLMLLIACGARGATPAAKSRPEPGVEITLYRDHAVVAHRIDVAIPAAAPATLRLRIAAGVDPDDLYLVEKGELAIKEVRVLGAKHEKAAEGCDEVSCVLDNYERACCEKYEKKPSEWDSEATVVAEPPKLRAPTDVEITVGGPREGTYSLLIGYDTPRIDWDAAYTLTTTQARDRALLRGALAVRNATGIEFSDARLAVVDAQHGTATARLAKEVGVADPNRTPIAIPRELSRVNLVEGDTRIEMVDAAAPRPMRSVLVFDPIGPGLDYQHGQPVQDDKLGVSPPPGTRVSESLEIARAPDTQHLPGGPVRLLERKADGTIALLGEATLFGPATIAAAVDTIPIGTADKVTGKRERRELTIDNDRKRVVEEFALTIENERERPIEVVLREHLYRGENWTIAYRSVFSIEKEGKQQIAMRAAVPGRGKQTVLYVVVYSWDK